jgi:hypothetical protein
MEIPFVGYGDSRSLVKSLKVVQSVANDNGKIIQGHGGICESDRLTDDIRYIEEVRSMTAECLDSGKTAKEASAGIKLEDCLSKERTKFVTDSFGSFLWFHPANVERIYKELRSERG